MSVRFIITLTIFASSVIMQASPYRSMNHFTLVFASNETGMTSTSTSNPTEQNIRNGVNLALQDLGKLPSESIWIDHGESAERTLEAISKLNKMGPTITVGMGNSFQALLCAKRLTNNSILITPVATSDEILSSSKNIFLISNPNSVQAEMLVSELNQSKNKSMRVLLVNVLGCPYCENMSAQVQIRLKERSIAFEVWSLHLSEINNLAPQPNSNFKYTDIIVPALEAEAGRIIQALYGENQSVTFWGGDGWGPLARYILELPFAKKIKAKWLSHYTASISTQKNRIFVKNYRAKYKVDPVDTSAFFYESTIIANRMRSSKSVEEFQTQFRKVQPYEGLTGLAIPKAQYILRPMPLLELKNGQVVLAKMVTQRRVSHAGL